VKASDLELRRAYEQLCDDLSKTLYEEDPAAMGSSVSAPHDEYDEEAIRLAVALKNTGSRGEIAQQLIDVFSVAPDALVERVADAVAKFRMRCETARKGVGGE
jgi:hypothetical protein